MLHVDHIITFKIILHWLVDRLSAGTDSIWVSPGNCSTLTTYYILGFKYIEVNTHTQIMYALCSEVIDHRDDGSEVNDNLHLNRGHMYEVCSHLFECR
jgi:hypothetical protein